MDSVRIRVLAQLEVLGTDWRDLGSRKGRTVLAVLALARGETVAIERLADLLWPERLPANPAEQVQVLVSRLRAVLGSGRIERIGIGYRLHYDWLDLDELELLAEAATERSEAGAAASARAAATAALRLLTGRPLDGEDGHWAEIERQRIARTASTVRMIAAQAALVGGHLDDAVRLAEEALVHEPFDEPSLRTLMRAHVAAGRPAAALAAYARTREAMADELGIGPTDETESLHTDVLLGRMSSPAQSAVHAAVSLVGRDDEMTLLDRQYDLSTFGPGRLVLLVGEPGIGKTTVLNEWARRALARGAAVVSIQGDPIDRDLPFQPLFDALGHAGSASGSATATALATVVGEPAAQRAQLYADFLDRLHVLAAGRPTVMAVDDGHVLDDSTIAWLQFAARRSPGLLVVVAVRPPKPLGLTPTETIALGPLDRSAAELLVGESSADAHFARSGGNPLLMIELSRSTSDTVPSAILDASRQRADALGNASATVRTAAVLGVDIDIDLVAACTQRQLAEVLDHLERAVAAELLVETRSGFAFVHELIRDALAQTVTPARRAFIHREATKALRQTAWSTPARTAFHARQGGAIETASQALMDGAAIAVQRFDLEVAERLLDESIRLLDAPAAHIARARVRMARSDHAGAADDVDGLVAPGADESVFELAGWIAYYRRDLTTARRFVDEALRLATHPEIQRSAHALAGRIDHSRGELTAAAAHLEHAVVAQVDDSVGKVWLGALRVHQGRFDDALATLNGVESATVRHPFACAHAAIACTMANGLAGRLRHAFTALDDLDRVVADQGAQGGRFRSIALNLRGWLLRSVGHDAAADACNLSALGVTTDPAFDEPHAHARLDLAEGCLRRHDHAGAAKWLDETERRLRPTSTMAWHIRQRRMWLGARVALSLGHDDQAATLASTLIEDSDRRGSQRYSVLGRHTALICETRRAPQASGAPTVHALVDGLRHQASLDAWWLLLDLADALDDGLVARVARTQADRLLDEVDACPSLDLGATSAWVADRFARSPHGA
jgi:DNA-binding SARP family transcriptional activator